MKRHLQTFNFCIQNAAGDSLDIYIDGQIVDASTQQILKDWWGDETSVSFKSFRDQINASSARIFNIYINSPGGHVGDAMAIHDLIKDLQAKGKTVNTIGRGIIASAATYILMAGNSEMSKNSWFMIHNASGYAYGTVDEVENQARTLRKFNDAIRDFYASATGMRKEDISKMMNSETWMTADEAKEKGFVSKVSGETSFTNAIAAEQWNYSNLAVLNSYNSAVRPPREADMPSLIQNQFEDMKKFFNDFAATIKNAISGVKPAENGDQTSLVNSIAEAVSNSFASAGEQMEQSVNEIVNAAVKTAVENATKDLSTKVTNLETAKADADKKVKELEEANKGLEEEITNLKGGKSTSTTNEGPAPIGAWK